MEDDTLPKIDEIKLKWKRRGFRSDSAEVINEILTNLRVHIGLGKDDGQILEDMDATPSELRNFKEMLFRNDSHKLNGRPAEEVFLEYQWQMTAVVKELDVITDKAKKDNQFNPAVSAQKAKAKIIDDVMNRGQEMGVITRAAKRTEVVGGILVGHLDAKELRDAITTAARGVSAMLSRYSDVPMSELSIADVYDVEPVVIKAIPAEEPAKVVNKTGKADKVPGLFKKDKS